MSDGIMCDNRIMNRVEPLISVKQLRERFLFGIDVTDGEGNPLPDEVFQSYLDTAISLLEHDLDIAITPRTYAGDCAELKDYRSNDYIEWGYFQLNNIPIIEVKQIRAHYQGQDILKYPPEWYRIQKHDGIVRLIPNTTGSAQFMADASTSYLPELFRNQGVVPLLWEIDYTAGFKNGEVPIILNTAIGVLAAVVALINLSDLVLGAGIASQSIGLDGLSQAVTLTASAENNTNSAKILDWKRLLWGDSVNSPNQGIIRTLRTFYQGQTVNII